MDSKETLSALLDADKRASKLRDDASRVVLEQESRIKMNKDALRREYAQMAEDALAERERVEAERAEAELARLERETDARLAEILSGFERVRDRYCDRLFAIVTGAPDAK